MYYGRSEYISFQGLNRSNIKYELFSRKWLKKNNYYYK